MELWFIRLTLKNKDLPLLQLCCHIPIFWHGGAHFLLRRLTAKRWCYCAVISSWSTWDSSWGQRSNSAITLRDWNKANNKGQKHPSSPLSPHWQPHLFPLPFSSPGVDVSGGTALQLASSGTGGDLLATQYSLCRTQRTEDVEERCADELGVLQLLSVKETCGRSHLVPHVKDPPLS